MQHLLQSWKDALTLFLPRIALPFFLVTIKTIMHTYTIFFKNFWWLFGLSSLLELLASFNSRFFGQIDTLLVPVHISLIYLQNIAWITTVFALYLTIRPSIKRKTFDYYKDYGKHYAYFLLLILIGVAVPSLVVSIVCKVMACAQAMHSWCYIIALPFLLLPSLLCLFVANYHLPFFVSPLLTFTLLFLLDSRATFVNLLKSIVKGVRMVVYNYPFCLLIFIVFTACSLCLQRQLLHIFTTPHRAYFTIISYLVLPIPLCLLTNFYTKRMHEQFQLYYPETIKDQT